MTHLYRGDGLDPAMNLVHRIKRDLQELLGLAKGMLADGTIQEAEADALREWLDAHPDVEETFPGRALSRRLRQIYADGRAEDDEREELKTLLSGLTGGGVGVAFGKNVPATFPIEDPLPPIEIPDRVFVLTGQFALGPRRACEDLLRRNGGWPEPRVTKRTDVLVIGTFASPDWRHSSFGWKIVQAVDYREKHGHPVIVTEDHWAAHL